MYHYFVLAVLTAWILIRFLTNKKDEFYVLIGILMVDTSLPVCIEYGTSIMWFRLVIVEAKHFICYSLYCNIRFFNILGSPDTIRLWDVVTGHPLTRMSTGRTEKHRETTVWSLIILNDFTVVSGDSRYINIKVVI